MKEIRSDEARRDWRDLLDEVQQDPRAATRILRYDKPVAVLVSDTWYQESVRIRTAAELALTFADAFRDAMEASDPDTPSSKDGP